MITPDEALEIADGNQDAANFLLSFQAKAHLMDDAVDMDRVRSDAEHAEIEADWLLTLTTNPFVLRHSGKLVPVLLFGLNAWLDANQMQRSVIAEDRRTADVVKGMYGEVVFLTAHLCGGWNHMRAMSQKFRKYDFEKEEH